MNNLNIIIVGVGGQGSILASKVIGNVGIINSCDVKMAEVHGMAQRGGSVITSIKLGDKVYSPLVETGEADIILAFEQLEGLRRIERLSPEGTMILNTQKIDPMPVIIGQAGYPENIIEEVKEKYTNIVTLDALEMAKEAGSMKTVNTVSLGVMSTLTDFPVEDWEESIREFVPEAFVETNLKAFAAGRKLGRDRLDN
ncbi:MAG: indolepyruvate oxidoreductase subunit beta [Bacillota bacterium]